MDFSEKLDKVFELGFEVYMCWKDDFCIQYDATDLSIKGSSETIEILYCVYYDVGISYKEMVELSLDLFFEWYDNKLDIIKSFDRNYDIKSRDLLSDHSLGNISKRIYRNFKLDEILNKD